MTTEQTPSSPIVKTENEFVEVFTSSDLLSTTSSVEFPPVVTETSIADPPSIRPETEESNLVAHYDEVFPTHDTYLNFVDCRLALWKNSMEVKYFDALYNSHQQTTETMRKLRLQAQAILEEADKMQQQNSLVKKEINRHVATIANSELRKRLSYPRKVYP